MNHYQHLPPLRIGIVCYPSVGGSGVLATELGHTLASYGHQIHFITYEPPFRLQINHPNIYFHEVEVHQYELFRYPDYALQLAVKMAEVSKDYSLDILHVHYAIPHATSAFLTKQMMGAKRPAVITTLHGTDITLVGRDPAFFPLVKFSIEESDGVTAVSHNLKEETCKHFKICSDIEVIHNFFTPESEFIGKKPMQQHWAPNGEKILLHASNFRHIKRVEDVVSIFRIVRETIPSRLVLVGTGAGIEPIRKMVFDYELDDEVIFVGKRRHMDPYLSSADLFLLPSSQESFGLAALEAMSYGIPVIATDIGGLPELIESEKNGFLSPVGDVEKMSRDAIRLLTDKKLYHEISQAAMHRAREQFCAHKIVGQYESFYRNILAKSR